MAGKLVLLGPQRPEPNAPGALAELEGQGPVVVIAAGWQQDETEEQVFKRHLGEDAEVLPLYGWFDRAVAELPNLHEQWRARQDALIRIKALHRTRLAGALVTVRSLLQEAPDRHSSEALALARADVRRVDRALLDADDRHRLAVGNPWAEEPLIQRFRDEAREVLLGARAILIAGGHVAVLRNRLEFFGVDAALVEAREAGIPIVAWSAGAMALTERIVLFYDDPPDGPSFPEILCRGVGMVSDLVLLPHARQRLRLDEAPRVELLAARFAPASCVALENGAWLTRGPDGTWANRGEPGTAQLLRPDGQVRPLHRLEHEGDS